VISSPSPARISSVSASTSAIRHKQRHAGSSHPTRALLFAQLLRPNEMVSRLSKTMPPQSRSIHRCVAYTVMPPCPVTTGSSRTHAHGRVHLVCAVRPMIATWLARTHAKLKFSHKPTPHMCQWNCCCASSIGKLLLHGGSAPLHHNHQPVEPHDNPATQHRQSRKMGRHAVRVLSSCYRAVTRCGGHSLDARRAGVALVSGGPVSSVLSFSAPMNATGRCGASIVASCLSISVEDLVTLRTLDDT
jgi:hypothetical protein